MSDNLVLALYSKHPDPCPNCGGNLLLHDNGKYGPYYGCQHYPDCRGSAGAHPDGRPMGHAVKKEVKVLRILAHKLFDQWRINTGISRTKSYQWLSEIFEEDDIHIANLEENQLVFLIRTVQKEMKK